MILEVRSGEGGADAAQFAQELHDALTSYVRRKSSLQVSQTGTKPSLQVSKTGRTLTTDVGEVDLSRFCGTHRIQRIPKNDKKGRRHTSTATVAVLEHHSKQAKVDEADIDVKWAKGTGPGGQHRNTSDTKCVLRHRPTGISAMADERTQHASYRSALSVLEDRVASHAEGMAQAEMNNARRDQIASGERPVKQFTHNEQRDESIDHESGEKWRMKNFMKGRL